MFRVKSCKIESCVENTPLMCNKSLKDKCLKFNRMQNENIIKVDKAFLPACSYLHAYCKNGLGYFDGNILLIIKLIDAQTNSFGAH